MGVRTQDSKMGVTRVQRGSSQKIPHFSRARHNGAEDDLAKNTPYMFVHSRTWISKNIRYTGPFIFSFFFFLRRNNTTIASPDNLN